MSQLFQRGREKLDKTRESLKRRGESLRRGPEDTEEVRQPKIRKTGDPIPALRLRNPTGTLISKPEDIPDDWDPNDDDIDENDLDATITRCQDRIRDNILPTIWENRLVVAKKMKTDLEALVASEPGGLSMEIVVRLKRLEAVKASLLGKDKYGSIPNIDVIMSLYRSGDYRWDYGTASYWSKGVLIVGPKRFDEDEFLMLSSTNDGQNGFWMELHDEPGLSHAFAANIRHVLPKGTNPTWPTMHALTLQFRTPGSQIAVGLNLEFFDDTGADRLLMFENDVNAIVTRCGALAPFCYSSEVALVLGGRVVTQWSRWPVAVQAGAVAGRTRLCGPYLRQMVYTGTAPERPARLCLSSSVDGLKKSLPSRAHVDTTPSYWGLLPRMGSTSTIATGTAGGTFQPQSCQNYYTVTTPTWPNLLPAQLPGPGVPVAGTPAGIAHQAPLLAPLHGTIPPAIYLGPTAVAPGPGGLVAPPAIPAYANAAAAAAAKALDPAVTGAPAAPAGPPEHAVP